MHYCVWFVWLRWLSFRLEKGSLDTAMTGGNAPQKRLHCTCAASDHGDPGRQFAMASPPHPRLPQDHWGV